MATAAILKNQPLTAQLHMAYDIPTNFIKFDEGISEKSSR